MPDNEQQSVCRSFPNGWWIPRTEYPYWACSSAMPDEHGIVEGDFPRVKEDGSRVGHSIPLPYGENFPKLINIGWGVSVNEPKFTSDGVKSVV